MVQIVIHSSKGKVLATPMACVDLEKSIPEDKPFVINADDTSTDSVNEDNEEKTE